MHASTVKQQSLKDYLQAPDTYATVLLAILIDLYGAEALSWDFLTVEQELFDDLGVKLPQLNRDKMQAIILLVTTDQVQNDWLIFNTTCEALNNDPVNFEQLDPLTPEQLAWGFTEILINEDPKAPVPFSDEVRRYAGALLSMHGMTKPSDILTLAIMPDTGLDVNALDDPIMYGGYFSRTSSDNKYISEYVRDRVRELIIQLDQVPLSTKDSGSWSPFKTALLAKVARVQELTNG